MKKTKNERGFPGYEFKDSYGKKCRIEKSSVAFHQHIWLGIMETKLTISEDKKFIKTIEIDMPKNFMVDTEMHLDQKQVAELIPILQKFVDTGEIS